MEIQSPIHIVLADDDEDDRINFHDAINQVRPTTRITLVNDGAQLMKLLEDLPLADMPSLVFIDLNMPKKNGHECIREIRSNARLKNLTVAIYSTSSTEEDIEQTFIQGANIYIKKPDEFSQLVRVLNEVITLNWQYHTADLNKDNFYFSI